jgi:apolipoprotein N-acyltransferase
MTNMQKNNLSVGHKGLIPAAIIFSGLCWYFGNGLSGDFWYLLWLAPVPVLIISLNASAKQTFIISFLAYLIGRFSWFSYLVDVATLVPAIIFTLVFPLAFALIMIATRRTVVRSNRWYAVFVYPVFFTAFELLLINFSPDGTVASIAYSQMNFLPVIQVASITGILGITFFVSLIPSAIAVGWYYRREKIKFRYILMASLIIIISTLLFAIIRISKHSEANMVSVGLVVLDEKFHNVTDNPDFQKEKLVTEYYAKEISSLATKGAELVVLPERAINVSKETGTDIIKTLSDVAKQNHVFIITGYTNFRNEKERNSALVIDTTGNVVVDYNKVHLVKGLEDQFVRGKEIALFKQNGVQAGTAICKDLDFTNYIKKYGASDVTFLTIPAWDFVRDDWLHSRMAVLRGVENGFSEVRTARQGRLTISDYLGRVTYEANSSNGKNTSLLGRVSLQKRNTIYKRFGNWFEITILIATICLALVSIRNNNVANAI